LLGRPGGPGGSCQGGGGGRGAGEAKGAFGFLLLGGEGPGVFGDQVLHVGGLDGLVVEHAEDAFGAVAVGAGEEAGEAVAHGGDGDELVGGQGGAVAHEEEVVVGEAAVGAAGECEVGFAAGAGGIWGFGVDFADGGDERLEVEADEVGEECVEVAEVAAEGGDGDAHTDGEGRQRDVSEAFFRHGDAGAFDDVFVPSAFPFGGWEGWRGLEAFRDDADFTSCCFHGQKVSRNDGARQGRISQKGRLIVTEGLREEPCALHSQAERGPGGGFIVVVERVAAMQPFPDSYRLWRVGGVGRGGIIARFWD
jgi:hypothetical protein